MGNTKVEALVEGRHEAKSPVTSTMTTSESKAAKVAEPMSDAMIKIISATAGSILTSLVGMLDASCLLLTTA